MTDTGVASAESFIVAQLWTANRVEERLREGFSRSADGDITIHGRIDAEGREPWDRLAGALRNSAAFKDIEGFARDHRGHYPKHGNVDVLPEPGSLRLMQRRKQADDAEERSAQVGEGNPDTNRRIAGGS